MQGKNKHIGFEGGLKVVTTKKQMAKDFPLSKKWTKGMKSMVTDKESFSKKNNEYFYGCTFKVPTNQEELADYVADAEFSTTLPFEERLNYELSKVNVSAFVKNKNFVIGDKITNESLPSSVTNMLAEIVKIKMLVEYEIHGDDEIRKTIPEIDSKRVDPKVVQKEIDQLKQQIDEDTEMDLDTILDKINMYGMGSVTKKELDFLNEQSRKS
jgi:hypothetical protein